MPNDPAPALDLAAIEQRANAATPGPWTWTAPGCDHTLADVRGIAGVPLSICMGADPTHGTGYDTTDAEFIAHARTDIPALVARVRALEAVGGVYYDQYGYICSGDERGYCAACQGWCADPNGNSARMDRRGHTADCPWRTLK